jgi:1-acyl-sn-glycerol-3-phosphate acyltransferase
VTKNRTFVAGNGLGARIFYKICWSIVVPIFRLYTRLTVSGREHLPTEGAYIIAPNHRSYLDTPFVGAIDWRRTRFMGKQEMWDHRVFGWIFSALGSFPVNRGSADREALQRAIDALSTGDPLVLFPEGERKQGPEVQPLFKGAAYVAIKAGVPIVPVGIGGSERVMPKGAKFIYPRKVHLEIGPPIMPPVAAEGERLPRNAHREHTELLHREIQRLFDLAMDRVGWSYPIDSQSGA